MNIKTFLSEKVQEALVAAGANVDCKAQVRKSAKTQFGDYQVDGIMSIAKQMCLPSRVLAEKVVKSLNLNGIARDVNIAGPGFINIFLDLRWIENQLIKALFSSRLGITSVLPQTIVVDYSSPNIAKEMHIGHVRSTIVGDALVRVLTFLGHNVIRANHVGDWGTQFGMLIAYLEKLQDNNKAEIKLSNLESFYRAAKQHYDEDLAFAKRARSFVVKLQSGDEYCQRMWQKLVDVTMTQNQKIYDLLNVTLTRKDVIGESFYSNMLPEIVTDLKSKGLAVESEGAVVVYLEEFKNKKGEPMGVIIQKKDDAYLYTTIDIACAKYRYETLKANRIIYYIDSRQHQHLLQAWTIARKAGYVPESVTLEHHMLGIMLDSSGKPFKTRTGKTIKLNVLLNEAIDRARRLITQKNPMMKEAELEKLAQAVGIGAVKYADLSKSRTINYIFNWDSMLSFEGNTAPYMQYAYTRIISILKRNRKSQQQLGSVIQLAVKQEIQLAVCLLQLEEAIMEVARNGMPHILCNYLYNLAGLFSSFYENCPILTAENRELRQSRLQLSMLTARTLKKGLNLLGIEIIDQM